VLLFFASWDQEVMDLKAHLDELNAYETEANAAKLPRLFAVDEGSVEPNPQALPQLLAQLKQPLSYPVAVDSSGQVAVGFGVQDEPWLVLMSRDGTPLWFHDVSTAGWLSSDALVKQVRAALKTASGPLTASTIRAELAGSPAPLAALHAQASKVFGNEAELAARIRKLRGYPIVVNIWGSWCSPCRAESKLFASASARYGRQVAFLGADANDNTGTARAFLAQHHVSYPSYSVTFDNVTGFLPQGLSSTPTTVFYNAAGQRTYVHIGQYESQGTLDSDVTSHALGG
jgi:thiol-disulfide isomerase/thioredoxin